MPGASPSPSQPAGSVPLRESTPSSSSSASGLRQSLLTRDHMDFDTTGGEYSSYQRPGVGSPSLNTVENIAFPQPESPLAMQLFDSFYYGLSLVLGYLLMLAIMSYNVRVCLITVFGCVLCHALCNYFYLTSWKRKYMTKVRKIAEEIQRQHGAARGLQQQREPSRTSTRRRRVGSTAAMISYSVTKKHDGWSTLASV
jgi:hypothetical protein